MKKQLLVAAMVILSGAAMAQNGMMKDGVMMKDGKMMVAKDGKSMPMTTEMTMSDGTKVMKDGTVMKKDGTKMTMKNGDTMDMSGMMKK